MKRLLVPSMLLALATPLLAQTPAHDPSDRLRAVLPPQIADQVLARIAEARTRQLPAAALEHRAFELVAKEADPSAVVPALDRELSLLEAGRAALQQGGDTDPSDAEIEAAGTAVGKGVDGALVSALARSAASGRSLAVPLFVISSLVDRGLPSDEALARVLDRLQAKAGDAEIVGLPGDPGLASGKPALTGQALALTKRPAFAGRPASVPANRGRGSRPKIPGKPDNPGNGGS